MCSEIHGQGKKEMCVNKFVNKKGTGIQAFYVDKNEKYVAEKYLLYV